MHTHPATGLACGLAAALCCQLAFAQDTAMRKPMAEARRPASATLAPAAAPDLRAQEEAAERLLAANRQLLLAAGRISATPGGGGDQVAACGGGPKGPRIPDDMREWVLQGGREHGLTPDWTAGRACEPPDVLLASSTALGLAAQASLAQALKARGGKWPQQPALSQDEKSRMQRGLGLALATLHKP